MKFIGPAEAASAIDSRQLFHAMERAFRAHASGQLPPPTRLDSYLPHGEFHVKAGHTPGYFAVKANSAFFDNPPNRPAIQGVIVIYDSHNGEPLAVIDSGAVTAMRTAAVTAVAMSALGPHDARSLALVGAGVQAWAHARALRDVLPVDTITVWSARPASAEALCGRIREELGVKADAARTPADAVARAQVVVTCTPSTEPLLWPQDIPAGCTIAAVGADSPHKQELAAEITASATLVTDLTQQCLYAGELHHAVSDGLMTVEDVYAELGQILLGQVIGRQRDEDVIVFDSTGTGFQDAAAGAAILRALG